MFAKVREDVDERAADFARRLQRVAVVTPRPELAGTPPESTIQPDGRANRQTLNSARQRARVIGLHEKMNVIGLQRIMNDSKVPALGTANGRRERPLGHLRS
jgi:hypothetical protein